MRNRTRSLGAKLSTSAKLFSTRLSAGGKAKFLYEYDFGDGWLHDILVEKLMDPGPGKQYPICCAGKRAGPPEDCGGPWGYYNLLEAIGDPSHPEHEDLLEWVGGEYDPEAFDLNEVNKGLKPFRKRKKKQ